MTDNEIDEEIQASPGKSDLEIALALQTDEGSVRKRRTYLIEREKGADAVKAKERAEAEAKVTKEKAAQAQKDAALKAAKARTVPVKEPLPEAEPPKEGEPEVVPKRQKYYLRSKAGNVIELFRANDSKTTIIFESNEY
jgi:hypothetical protein